MEPLLSLVIPCYASGSRISACLTSIYKAAEKVDSSLLEVILSIEPCEGDDTAEKAALFLEKMPYLKIMPHPIHLGPLGSRLHGARNAKGKYVCFLDADDAITEDYFVFLIEEINKEDWDILNFGFYVKRGDSIKKDPYTRTYSGDGIKMLDALFTDVSTRGFMWARCMKIELVTSYDGPVPDYFEDTIFSAIVIPKARKAVSIDHPLVIYDKGVPGSMTTKANPRRYRHHVEAFALVRAYYDINGMDKEAKILSKHRIRHSLSLAYDKSRSKKDGASKKDITEAKALFRAAMDLKKPILDSRPELKELLK